MNCGKYKNITVLTGIRGSFHAELNKVVQENAVLLHTPRLEHKFGNICTSLRNNCYIQKNVHCKIMR